ncbi:MAG: XRE family transcriptional regulator [Clostridiales bacterium]|nr:XRE family transcriptional regulator [Clostridiales bacterium]
MNIGDRIRQLREQLELTQEEVGNKIGVTKATVNRYETGEIDIKRTIAIKLAEVLNTTPSYIMGWELGFPSEEKEQHTKLDAIYETQNIISDLKHANNETFVMNGYNGQGAVTIQSPTENKYVLAGRGAVINITEAEFDALKVVLETMRPKNKN